MTAIPDTSAIVREFQRLTSEVTSTAVRAAAHIDRERWARIAGLLDAAIAEVAAAINDLEAAR